MVADVSELFADDYVAARRAFLLAAGEIGAAVDGRVHEEARGPRGEALWLDAARYGPPDARRVLLTLSGVHGVEGFCGGAMQLGTLRDLATAAPLPRDTALLCVHAVNPYGFAALRRVDADNIDVNRNFLDWEADPALPDNPGYRRLRDILSPAEWDPDANLAAADAARAEIGETAWRTAHSGGQHADPGGIFYAGQGPSWSRQALFGLLDRHLAGVEALAVIDYHTGLGPPGHGERICMHDPDGPAMARARTWYDGDVTSPHEGTAATVPLAGTAVEGIARRYPGIATTAVALEFGTIEDRLVQLAVRADNWLHMTAAGQAVRDDPAGYRIKRDIRAAYDPADPYWREAVWTRAVATQRAALAGLATG